LPDGVSQLLEGVIKNRGHYLMLQARKPLQAAAASS
jgi:hypothetical protein